MANRPLYHHQTQSRRAVSPLPYNVGQKALPASEGRDDITELKTRRLGRTDLLVTELGFGGSNVGAVTEGEETLTKAFSLGINFVETGRAYEGSEFAIGRALRRLGPAAHSVHVASKTLGRSRDTALRDLEQSLHYLGRQPIDIYQLNSVGDEDWERVMAEGGALKGLQEAQANGLIRFIGISSHSLDVLRWAIRSGQFDTVQLKYSAFDSRSASLIRLAHKHDVGTIGMKPFGGFGMLGSLKRSPYEERLSPETLIRYVLSNPCLSVSIPGMRFPHEVEQNVQIAKSYDLMTSTERLRLRSQARRFLAGASRPAMKAGRR
jgi:predicted aldo/keto reductase-like oxidoreductase